MSFKDETDATKIDKEAEAMLIQEAVDKTIRLYRRVCTDAATAQGILEIEEWAKNKKTRPYLKHIANLVNLAYKKAGVSKRFPMKLKMKDRGVIKAKLGTIDRVVTHLLNQGN